MAKPKTNFFVGFAPVFQLEQFRFTPCIEAPDGNWIPVLLPSVMEVQAWLEIRFKEQAKDYINDIPTARVLPSYEKDKWAPVRLATKQVGILRPDPLIVAGWDYFHALDSGEPLSNEYPTIRL